ncbi:MAG: preprotein translocase subunit SecA [Phycisphaerae bacterium]|jgi:preprotein translocase subunit SecA
MLGLINALVVKLIGGTRNERIVRARMKIVLDRINPLEAEIHALSDDQMRQRSAELKKRREEGAPRASILPEAFALVREATRRAIGLRHFDVQLVAGMILDEGWIAEEATGEGKTIACYPAIYMAYLDGMKVHVVTVNDFLVERDANFARPVFDLLGVTVGFITGAMSAYGPESQARKEAYACDVTYGMNNEFGFDYLRDNTKVSLAEQVQGRLDFAIVDEVDSILIDEARTPLILSGPAYGDTDRYRKADAVARELIERNRTWDRANAKVEALKRQIKALNGELSHAKGGEAADIQKQLDAAQAELASAEERLKGETQYFKVEMDKKSAHMTHEGVTLAQDIAGVGSFYVGANMEWPHLMEQSLRAHVVYERDKEYVVQNGAVIIVDEFTGRLLEGRQWSEGLHQAVEAKERVQVKEESQTMATVTFQNYFRLYKKLAGMTGTAMTEAAEFAKIYKLDIASVITHRPVNRVDHNDRIYGEVPAKYEAIAKEVNDVSRKGRPVLVGTTSIEKSEHISMMLKNQYGIEHQVLNARPENAGREAEIVSHAGQQRPLKLGSKQMVGTVTIATNMAGRGTDIKLGPGVVWPNCQVPPPEKLAELGVEVDDLYPSGVNKCCINCQQYDASTDCAHCFKPKIDADFPARGRTDCRSEVPCGLHIVGTERHEARRIDNQLRGRSGRQGDPGSSRFFLSLRDDLMSVFAGEWTLKVLGWLGLQGDTAIEDKRVSKGIERAQKKVEERNFETRKNLLEYDEVMDYQRRAFYSRRQNLLEGRDLEGIVMDMISQSIAAACASILDGRYPHRCIAEWASNSLQMPIRPEQIKGNSIEDLANLEDDLRNRAKEETRSEVSKTLGEYMDSDLAPKDWDLRGLSSWAMSRFNVNLSQNQLRKMDFQEVDAALTAAAEEKVDQFDLSPVAAYLQDGVARNALAAWAVGKFGISISGDELSDEVDQAREVLLKKVAEAYRRREVEYPVEYAIEMTVAVAGTENVYALANLANWANRKFETHFTGEDFRDRKLEDIREQLLAISREWANEEKLEQAITGRLAAHANAEQAKAFAQERFDTRLSDGDFAAGDVVGKLKEVGRAFLRREMTELERFVLLQIYDTAWKDHLLAMDHLKATIGLRGFAEQDPRVAFKREGARLFDEMHEGVRDRVTDMIFKVRLQAGTELRSVYQISNVVHEQLAGYDRFTQEAADQTHEVQKVATIVRQVPRVGRNDPCSCGSGKKYKKCCGKGVE